MANLVRPTRNVSLTFVTGRYSVLDTLRNRTLWEAADPVNGTDSVTRISAGEIGSARVTRRFKRKSVVAVLAHSISSASLDCA